MEEQTRKSTKSRRETSVQGTNDSSIVSKCSTSTYGYFDDQFLHHFVAKQIRRAPLIHRGYYIRTMAFDKVFKRFIADNAGNKKQILSLGCGFDSTFFRLKAAKLLEDSTFYEIDFPDLVKRKHKIIESNETLMELLEKKSELPLSPHIEISCEDYYLLGVDLTQLNTLEAALKMCGLDFETPTLLFSECVMTYMTRRCSTDVVKWAAETFETATFAMYEQMNPDDAFGLFMQRHFHSIGSPLKCIKAFPTLDSQKERFLKSGWTSCEVVDMNTFYYQCLPSSERIRMENLEAFDEYEELNLKYSHYFILTAHTKCPASNYLLPESISQVNCVSSVVSDVSNIEKVPFTNSIRRFGHASSLVSGSHIITSGGFGEVDSRHQRLTDITITDINTLESHHIHCVSPHIQYSRMHHTSVALSNGSIYLIAGRQSPFFLCSQMLKLDLTLKNTSSASDSNHGTDMPYRIPSCNETKDDNTIESDKGKEPILPQVCNQVCDTPCAIDTDSNLSVEYINVCEMPNNGIQADDVSLTQCYKCIFGKLQIEVVNQSGDLPSDRWRHVSTAVFLDGVEKIFLHGGKKKCGEILADAYLFDPILHQWSRMSCCGDIPGPRHSHNAMYWKGSVILTGGLDNTQIPLRDVYRLDLASSVWERLEITGTLHARYSHTAEVLKDRLILIGGVHLSHPPPGVAVINLTTQTSVEYSLPIPDSSNLLMLHRITSVPVNSDQVLILGGGGNCFSFGTHLNYTPAVVNLANAFNALDR